MKAFKAFLTALLTEITVVNLSGQGTVQFTNLNTPAGVDAPVYESDHKTKLSGPQFVAELLAGSNANTLASIATTGFLTGNGAGYFFGPYQRIPGTSPQDTAFVQVYVWNTSSGASFFQAKASGLPNSWWASSVFSVVLGGGTVNPAGPAPLEGLGNGPVYLNSVPEPSVFAIFSLGAVGALLRNRMNRVE
jgi:hypothetical protein